MKLPLKKFFRPEFSTTIERLLRRTLVRSVSLFGNREPQRHQGTKLHKAFVILCVFVSSWFSITCAQKEVRISIPLNKEWYTRASDSAESRYNAFETSKFDEKGRWKQVNVPHNWDAYEGYRRKLHGNRHGCAYYIKYFDVPKQQTGKRIFLFFEGVGSYATIWLNEKKVGYHAGGRTSFTIDITEYVRFDGTNHLHVQADHPAGIKNLPWVCGGCSDERGFSEGSQPMGIFRPVSLLVTNDVRIEPFGVHVWNGADVSEKSAQLFWNTEVKNYSGRSKTISLVNRLLDKKGITVAETNETQQLAPGATVVVKQQPPLLNKPQLWSLEDPYLYTLVTEVVEDGKPVDRVTTPFGIRTIKWQLSNGTSKQFLLNGKPVFINGIAEYEHLLGGSHAFTEEQIRSRVMQMKAAGFNAFRDAHHPHNLRYQAAWDSLGLLWWTQMGAHVWYDNPDFRKNFKQLLTEWVKERRNNPSNVMWGLQNESKLPEDFARECTELIRQLDPTTSSQRLVTTCNGGSGTDWDVPQNWTGTYGGNPATYSQDLKRQILVGEYGAWRTLDLHTEGPFVQNGPYSEDRFCQLMETKIRLAEAAKDSSAGHYMWLWTSHDNPGRVQGGEGYRELDRVGPVNYKGLLTPWEEPTDAFYMYRSNYADKHKEPMVYIASHTWPDRWTKPGKKSGLVVYSNCDEVELFNDVRSASLGRKKRGGIGTHFTWDDANIQYNVLYAVGYVNGKEVAKDYIVLHHLPQSPRFNRFYEEPKSSSGGARGGLTAPQAGYNYLYRVNCGGPAYTDSNGNHWSADRQRTADAAFGSTSWTKEFPGLPPYFASQRMTHDPIRGTKDWKLFQSFRYGREKLCYDFPVPDGEYRVELYFTEPWLGAGGGMNASGWRLFDVAINGKTVLKNLDIWKEAGHDGALKKVVTANVTGGLLTVSFPRVAAGQALISAIAVAAKNRDAFSAQQPQSLLRLAYDSTGWKDEIQDWLATGDEAYEKVWQKETVRFSALPSELAGAQWIKGVEGKGSEPFVLNTAADVYLAVDTAGANPQWAAAGFSELSARLQLSTGATYRVVKKRAAEETRFETEARESAFVMVQPASAIEPAYDLKPVTSYKAVAATLSGAGMKKGKIDGKDRALFETASAENRIDWNVTVGVADTYSLTVSYNNPLQKNMTGRLQLLSADGTLMKEEAVEFTPTREGKSNYITTNTGSMINAGHYIVRLTAGEAAGLSVNALDVQ